MTAFLLACRLRWYALSTARLLLRRWQGILLALGILAPAATPLLMQIKALAFPLTVLLSPAHGFTWRLSYIALLHMLGVLWAVMQREQIGGGAFMHYTRSLPVPRAQRRVVDALLLLLANSPLLIPVIAAAAVVGMQVLAPFTKTMHILFLFDLCLLLLVAQLAALDRTYAAWVPVATADVLLAAAPGSGAWQAVLLALAALTAVGLALFDLPRVHAALMLAWWHRCARPLLALARGLSDRLHPRLSIPLYILLRQRMPELLGKLVTAASIAGVATGLMTIWEYDSRALPMAVIALSMIALVLSGLYRGLQMAHAAARPFTASLPLPAYWPVPFDVLTMAMLGLPFAAGFGALLVLHRAASGTAEAIAGGAFFLLLAGLRVPQVHAERQAVVSSTVATALWTALTIYLLRDC